MQVTFTFSDCSYDIKQKKSTKRVVSSASGSVETGHLVAVIGPSGAGKTTLLNMLRLKPGPGKPTGDVRLNGHAFTREMYKRYAASAEQGATVWPMLTAREQITYTFELARPSLSAQEKVAAVDEMIESLGLLSCQDVKAGSGLSGGELRRLSLAAALSKRPSLLFLDEPTSGLDSAAAAGVMDLVSQLATAANTAVLCVIHQPSEAVFSMFDKALLLSCGRAAYFGPAAGIPMHFELLGQPLAAGMSISEAALNVINSDFAADATQVDAILDAWAARRSDVVPVRHEFVYPPPRSSFSSSYMTAFRRYVKIAAAEPELYVSRIFVFFVTSVFVRNATQILAAHLPCSHAPCGTDNCPPLVSEHS